MDTKLKEFNKHIKPNSRTISTANMTQGELEKHEAKLDRDDEVKSREAHRQAYAATVATAQTTSTESVTSAKPAAAMTEKAEVAKFMNQNSAYYQAKMDAALGEF